MKFGFTMADGTIVDIKNINSSITINNDIDYTNNKLKNSNIVYSNGEITKEISFTSVVPSYEKELLNTYNEAWKKNINQTQDVIIYYNLFDNGENYLDSSPNYYFVGYDITEELTGNVIIEWSFVEFKAFKPTKKSFKIWSKNQTAQVATKKTEVKKTSTDPSNNTKLLLSKCGNLNTSSPRKSACVKKLQKFLKSGGFYKGFLTDGNFEYYTKRELMKAQKRRKIPSTGKWDVTTRVYYIVKYKYPTKTYKNIINGKSTTEVNKAYKQLKKILNKKTW